MNNQSGFTIVEILMVILLVGIVSAVAAPQFIDFTRDANHVTTQQKLSELKQAIVGNSQLVANGRHVQPGYIDHLGAVPTSLDNLRLQGALPVYDPFSKKGWRGPYISTTDAKWNLDGWGTLLQYSSATRIIRSCGADKICATTDDLTIQF